jgi:hypothetical protein
LIRIEDDMASLRFAVLQEALTNEERGHRKREANLDGSSGTLTLNPIPQ